MTAFLQRTVRIEWGHCDPAGIVHAPRYFDIFGQSTMLLFEQAGLPKKREMLATMPFAGFPMVDVSARFFVPTAYGDDVLVEAVARGRDGLSLGRWQSRVQAARFVPEARP